MAKGDKAKRGPGRPVGTGIGYTEVVRVLLTKEQFAALKGWQAENDSLSESDAARRLIVESLKRPGRARTGKP